jgi:hypothetical protein
MHEESTQARGKQTVLGGGKLVSPSSGALVEEWRSLVGVVLAERTKRLALLRSD